MRKQEKSVYQHANYLSSNQVGRDTQEEEQQKEPSPQHMRLALEECIQFIDSLSIGPQDDSSESEFGSPLSARDVTADLSTTEHSSKKLICTSEHDSVSIASTLTMEARKTCRELKYWREQMCSWSYAVMDSFGFDRETVAVAFSLLDRYVAVDTEPEAITQDEFQTMSMTALYTATKILEPDDSLTTDSLIEMSRGHVCLDDVIAMEMKMLFALEWRLNPPTALAFVREFLECLPISAVQKQDMMTMSFHLTELAVLDSFFIGYPPSSIAVATLLVAASYDFDDDHGLTATSFVANELEKNLVGDVNIDIHSEEISTVYDRLERVYIAQHAQ